MKSCLNCKKEHENPKFCSRSCSASYNNKGKRRNSTPNRSYNTKYCVFCSKEIIGKHKHRKKFCNQKCMGLHTKLVTENKILNGEYVKPATIRRYLIDKHGAKCMKCGWSEVNPSSGKVPIVMDHIDGNSENNSLDNLRLICPNCDSLLPTYKSLNRGNGRHKRRKRYQEGKSY